MDPDFLADQIDRSRANLGVDTIDVFYLHNPETQLGFLSREEFDARMRRAFARLEQLVDEQQDPLVRRRHLGRLPQEGRARPAAAWRSSPRKKAGRSTTSASSSCRSIWGWWKRSSNEAGKRAGGGGPAGHRGGRQRHALADAGAGPHAGSGGGIAARMTNAQRAIQFTRSTPGIAVALVGMGRRDTCWKTSAWRRCAPATHEQYLRLYQ